MKEDWKTIRLQNKIYYAFPFQHMSKLYKIYPPQSLHFHSNLVRVQNYEAPQYDIHHTLMSNIYLTSKSASQLTMSSYLLSSV
jgi:hypothetical protein